MIKQERSSRRRTDVPSPVNREGSGYQHEADHDGARLHSTAMTQTAAVLVALGQTLALIGASVVTVAAYRRARKPSEADVTWETVWKLDRFVDKRIARDAISWGALSILLGLGCGSTGAWLLVLG